MTGVLFTLAALAAAGDWFAVWQRFFRLEYLLKPLTIALLLGAAATADLPDTKAWVVAALAFSLLGDIALMFSADRLGHVDAAFVLGLLAFLGTHICYLVAFARYGVDGLQIIAGVLIVVGTAALTLPKVLLRSYQLGGKELLAIIGAYAALLGTMTVFAVGTATILVAFGGIAFLASDTILARDRFVSRIRFAPLLIVVTYHLAQLCIIPGLTP